MTYIAEYGIHVNSHISYREEHIIEADSQAQAEAKAEALGISIEKQLQAQTGDDIWAMLEGVYEE